MKVTWSFLTNVLRVMTSIPRTQYPFNCPWGQSEQRKKSFLSTLELNGIPTGFNYEYVKDLLRGIIVCSDDHKSVARATLDLHVEKLGEEEVQDKRPLVSDYRSLIMSRLGMLKREEAIASEDLIDLVTYILDLHNEDDRENDADDLAEETPKLKRRRIERESRQKVSNDNTAVKSAFSTGRGKMRAEESSSEANYDERDDDHGESYESYSSLDVSSNKATKGDKRSSKLKRKAEAAKKVEEDRQKYEREKRKFDSSNDDLAAILSQQVETDRVNAEANRKNAETQSQLMQFMLQQLKEKRKRSKSESEDEV